MSRTIHGLAFFEHQYFALTLLLIYAVNIRLVFKVVFFLLFFFFFGFLIKLFVNIN